MPLPVLLELSQAPPPTVRGTELLHAAFSPKMSVSSESALRFLGVAAELVADGRRIGLNVVGSVSTLSLADPVEGGTLQPHPLSMLAYLGRPRVGAAWQLVETFRQFRSTKPVRVGILDSGFWLNGFAPGVSPKQIASDLGSSVLQLNLLDEGVSAGGASLLKTDTGGSFPRHGNATASVATAKVGNGLGAAGTGGTVAEPVLFRTDASVDQFLTCLQYCLHWGVDILNMSVSFTESAFGEFWFPQSTWDDNFQFASDNGLIMVASAGNNQTRIPEDAKPRPATRTPGTITVGALDSTEQAYSYSNFGSSVDVWAPADIQVMPDPDSPNGRIFGGTSAAAPFVSGILAMMRAVAPVDTLDAGKAKQLLQRAGWSLGNVGIGVDAFAAVLAAMGGRLPDDQAEAHATAERALRLRADANGVLMPFRLRSSPLLDALSSASGENWYSFEVPAFSQFALKLVFYPLMGGSQCN
jgi:Subtilase family